MAATYFYFIFLYLAAVRTSGSVWSRATGAGLLLSEPQREPNRFRLSRTQPAHGTASTTGEKKKPDFFCEREVLLFFQFSFLINECFREFRVVVIVFFLIK